VVTANHPACHREEFALSMLAEELEELFATEDGREYGAVSEVLGIPLEEEDDEEEDDELEGVLD
jgi:hypothetical protein